MRDAGGVHDRPHVVEGRHELGQRGVVGDVAGGDGHSGAQVGQVRSEFLRTGSLGAPSAHQDQVRRAVACRPAGDVPSERAGSPGDQDGAPRRPRLPGVSRPVPGEAPGEHTAGPDGELVLAAVRQYRAEPFQRVLGEWRWQVHQPAPAPRRLESDDPAEAPDLRLVGVAHRVVDAGRHRARGEAPQRGRHVGE